MFKFVKATLKDILNYLWEKILLGKEASILMYHSVGDNREFFNVRPRDFAWQMEYLHRGKYKVVSLSELANYEKIPKNTVAITFDDGYEDNYLEAYPVLKKYNFPATIFLTTAWLEDKSYTNKRGIKMPMLDWNQIKEMHDSGLIDFEPHTETHPRLTKISDKIKESEILNSKHKIEQKLNKISHVFAYPFGDFNQDVIKIAKNFFKVGLTVESGFISKSDQKLRLKRQSIDSLVNNFRFRLKV